MDNVVPIDCNYIITCDECDSDLVKLLIVEGREKIIQCAGCHEELLVKEVFGGTKDL